MKFKEINYLYHKFNVGNKIIKKYLNGDIRFGTIRIIEFDTNWKSNTFVDYTNGTSVWCDPDDLELIK